MDIIHPEADILLPRPGASPRSRSKFTSQCPRDRSVYSHLATTTAATPTAYTNKNPLIKAHSVTKTQPVSKTHSCPGLARQDAFCDISTRSLPVHRGLLMLPPRCSRSSPLVRRRDEHYYHYTPEGRLVKRARTSASTANSTPSTTSFSSWGSGRAIVSSSAGLGIYLATPEPSDTEPDTDEDSESDDVLDGAGVGPITPTASFGLDGLPKPAEHRRAGRGFVPPSLRRSDEPV